MADVTNRVVHFEISASDPARAAKFYQAVFGWDIQKWEGGSMPYWMVMTGKGAVEGAINGGILQREGEAPANSAPTKGYVCIVEVADVDGVVKKITENGGKITKPAYDLPQVGRLAYAIDIEGNTFGVIKSIPRTGSPV